MKLAFLVASLLYGIFVAPEPPCDDLKVKAKVTHTTEGKDNGSVEIEVEGGEGKLYYFYHKNKYPISTEGNKTELRNLSSGNYSCTVISELGCNKKLNFTVE